MFGFIDIGMAKILKADVSQSQAIPGPVNLLMCISRLQFMDRVRQGTEAGSI